MRCTMTNIGLNLKKLRIENGYSQRQLAEYLEIDQSNLSKIENNIEELKKYIIGIGPTKNSYYVEKLPANQMNSFIRYANGFEGIVVRQSCLNGRIYLQEI